MKKFVSLLLVLVMALGLLSGIALADGEMPAECDAATAGVMVTSTTDASVKHYFENMSQDLILWACLNVPGGKVFTLLKDIDVSNVDGVGATRHFEIPRTGSEWTGAKEVTIDFNGHTMTYTGTAALFSMSRYGITFKNGTLIYNGTESRAPITIGNSKGPTATSNGGSVYAPHVVLDGMKVVTTRAKGSWAIVNYNFGTVIDILNSEVWSTKWETLMLRATTQDEAAGYGWSLWEGDFTATVNIKNSTVGSATSAIFSVEDEGYTINVKDSALVSGGNVGLYTEGFAAEIEDTSDMIENAEWTGTTPAGLEVDGTAYMFGKAVAVELPFDDVKESDWFYSFVQELYGKKIIAGQTATTFNPNGKLNYAAALKLLVVGVTGKDPGNAASGHWAGNYLAEAKAAGWTNIDAAVLNNEVTREAFCEIAAKAKGLEATAMMNPFTDTDNASVLALFEAGIISGVSADKFSPKTVLTRAQIAKIISGLLAL